MITSQARQAVVATTLQNAAAADGNGTVATVAGMNGAQYLDLQKTGTGTTTLTIEGSWDNATFYAIGFYQVDAAASLTRAASGIGVVGGVVNHLYQILDLCQYVRARMSATSGTVAVTAKLYAVPV